jgi:hypothetical protein
MYKNQCADLYTFSHIATGYGFGWRGSRGGFGLWVRVEEAGGLVPEGEGEAGAGGDLVLRISEKFKKLNIYTKRC